MYIVFVGLLNALVYFFLLMGTNRLAGYPTNWIRTAAASVLGGIYGGVCLLPGCAFFGGTMWRLISIFLCCVVSFGIRADTVKRSLLVMLAQFALSGIAAGIEVGGGRAAIAAAAIAAILWISGVWDKSAQSIPITLHHNGNTICVTALRDTGNTLKDPITGQPVLIVGADVANSLVGLTATQLRDPVGTMQKTTVTGLRLIPFHTVNSSGGMLLAMKIEQVRIGTWKGSCLVAFAPEGLGKNSRYQALTGGAA